MTLKKVLLIFALLAMMISSGDAEELRAERSIETGKMWGYTDYVVTYEISDERIAEVFKHKSGATLVRFVNPGDVYVRVTFYSGGQPAETELHLFHVTGEARGSTAVNRETIAEEILELVNAERARYGLKPLKLASDLNRYAATRAKEIVKQFSHTRPNGENGALIIPKAKYRGENLSAGSASAQAVMYQWMNSPEHRDNILFGDYEELGVGYVFDENGRYRHYWVQLFRTK